MAQYVLTTNEVGIVRSVSGVDAQVLNDAGILRQAAVIVSEAQAPLTEVNASSQPSDMCDANTLTGATQHATASDLMIAPVGSFTASDVSTSMAVRSGLACANSAFSSGGDALSASRHADGAGDASAHSAGSWLL
jgi:hypothetical protein